MSEHVVGIDPGIAGALALVSLAGDLIEVADMPILRDGCRHVRLLTLAAFSTVKGIGARSPQNEGAA